MTARCSTYVWEKSHYREKEENPTHPSHSGTGLIYEMVLVKKLKLEASGHECKKQFS